MRGLNHLLFEPVLLRENYLSRLDARLKIIFLILALILNLIFPGNLLQVSILVFYIIISWGWKVKPYYILGRLFIAILICAFFSFFRLANLHLILVILSGVSLVSLLSFSTAIEELLAALGKLGCPIILVEIVFLMYKYIFIFFEEAEAIYQAQVARLGYKDSRHALQSLSILVGMLIIRSFYRAEACYEAMQARGYKGSFAR